jgi:hypothetical protein
MQAPPARLAQATLHKDLERQQNFLDKMRSETR